jgi:hypothetical protein
VQPAPVCGSYVVTLAFDSIHYADQGGAGQPNIIVLVQRAQKSSLNVTRGGDQWRLRTSKTRPRFISSGEASSYRVASAGQGGEFFMGAKAAGGKRGSVAVAALPCAHLSGVTAPTHGAGFATLATTGNSLDLNCPVGPSQGGLAAQSRVDWTLSGYVAGLDTTGDRQATVTSPSDIRLVELDLPV